MSAAPLELPRYLPNRFAAVKFRNRYTKRTCVVYADEIRRFVGEEIEHFKASASACTVAKAGTIEQTAPSLENKDKRSRAVLDDLQKTVQDVIKNIEGFETPPLVKSSPPIVPTKLPSSINGDTDHEYRGDDNGMPLDYLQVPATRPNVPAAAASDDDDDDDDKAKTTVDSDDDVDDKKNKKKKRKADNDDDADDDDDSSDDSDGEQFKAARGYAKRRQPKKRPAASSSTSSQSQMTSNAVALRDNDRGLKKRGTQFTQRDVQQLLRNNLARVLPILEAPYTDLRYIHTSPEVAWNRFEIRMIEQIYYRLPMIVSCVTTLKGQVMSEGIKFMRNNVELLPTAQFGSYAQRHLEGFARQALDALLMYGVIPICYEMDPVTNQRWPYVPAINTFLLKRHDVRGALRYRFYWTSYESYANAWRKEAIRIRDGEGFRYVGRLDSDPCQSGNAEASGIYDPTVEIIHNLGFDILSNGSLSSKMAALLTTAYAKLRAQKARVVAESNAAAPTLFTEYDHQGEAKQSQNFKQGYFTSASGHDPEGADIRNMTYTRDAATLEAFAGLMQHYESVTGYDAADRFGVQHEDYRQDVGGIAVVKPNAKTADGVPAPFSTQYHLSAARRIVNGPQSHASGDYCQFMELLEDEVCNVIGVPRTYVNGTSIKSSGDLILNRFSDEVTQLKKKIGDVLTHCYRVLFLQEDVTEYMASEFRVARQNAKLAESSSTQATAVGDGTTASASSSSNSSSQYRQPELLTEDDLYETDSLKQVNVSFAKKASESVEELQQMLAFGAIDQSTFNAELARRNNFDPQQLQEEDNGEEMPLEMRRMLVPQLAEYIKMKFQERESEKQMKFQEKQAKNDQQFQRQQLQSQERVAKAAAKQKAAATSSSK